MQDVNNVIQGSESAFSADEYAQRIRRTRERLSSAGVDVMIVTGPENIFWLTGQQTPGYYTFQALLLPVEGDPVFVIRQLEYFNFIANTFISDAAIYQDGDNPVDFLVAMLQQRGWLNKRIGLDKRGWFLPIAVYEALQSKLGAIADTAGVIEPLRAVKSAAEVEKIAAAARYVDAGMRAGMAAIRSGADENALVSAMMGAAIAAGSEYVGMEPLVSTGPRSGVPHGTWRRRVMQDNDPVFSGDVCRPRSLPRRDDALRLAGPPARYRHRNGKSLSGSPAGLPRRHSSGRYLRSAAPGLPEGDRPRRFH
ncbi:creatinase [Klebsiella grimontii]|uniref:Creatinase n=1 Tax=Klebsiella grimontii TaxID=2058152 RepID=A0A7H4P6P1_9ENTR|nr:creatinase [Klebsiella grimontii]